MTLLKDLGTKKINDRFIRFGLYKCPICKNDFETRVQSVKTGDTTKCKSCSTKIKLTTHGLTNNKIYQAWYNIKKRCYDEKHKNFNRYGAIGINMCDEWLTNPKKFIEWSLKNGYKIGLEIDRINPMGGYKPNNCRWATRTLQARNTRMTDRNTSGFRGVSFSKACNLWTVQIGVNKKRIHLGYFKNAIDGALAYDKYVIDNNLEHSTNKKLGNINF